VLAHGVKGTQYPKLWIKVKLESVNIKHNNTTIPDIHIFLNFDLDPNESSNKGKYGSFIKNALTTKKFIMVNDLTFTNISRGKKNEAGEWTNVEEPGLKTNIRNIVLSDTEMPSINIGLITGTVTKQSDNKILLKQQYRIPGEKGFTYKDREVPLYLDTDIKQDILGKKIFVQGKIAHNKEADKTYVITSTFVSHD
jgi:hypothetical protein